MIEKFNPQKTKYIKLINIGLKIFFHEKKCISHPDITDANNVLIIDPALIGDIVMLIPFLRILRRNNPECYITLACGKWAEAVLGDQGLVDEFIFIDSALLNSTRRLATDRKKIKEQIGLINKRYYDYALEPRGDLRYIYFMHYCNAKRKVSYNYTGGECFLTDVITPADNVVHLVEDKLYFLKQLGCTYKEDELYPKVNLSSNDRKKGNAFVEENHLQKMNIVGIHPGASLEKKRWEYFGPVLGLVKKAVKNTAFIIFKGPGEDEAVRSVEDVAYRCGAKYIISESSIKDYIIRISECDLVLCNDSGAGHLAAALGVMSFVLFGPFYPEMVKPYSKNGVVTFSKKTSCKPCLSQTCGYDKECLRNISAEEVAGEIISFLRRSRED